MGELENFTSISGLNKLEKCLGSNGTIMRYLKRQYFRLYCVAARDERRSFFDSKE